MSIDPVGAFGFLSGNRKQHFVKLDQKTCFDVWLLGCYMICESQLHSSSASSFIMVDFFMAN